MGGHLRIIEANSRGVVWGIGYDHTAWVYTGGYGGGCFQGEDGSEHLRLARLTPQTFWAYPPLIPIWLPFPAPRVLSQHWT